jgi:putative restriction endonuclease
VPFEVDDGRHTLLLGYHEATATFAAWEVRAHPNPGSSSSLQISLETLKRARDEGFASQTRELGSGAREVVVAFQRTLLSTYLEILPELRIAIVEDSDAEPAQTATEGVDPPPQELPDAGERQIAIRQIAARVRDARFRARVTAAYGRRCAFCDLDLGLVDAAHLKPVADGGPDQIVNGVAACPTHHRALDRGLLLIKDDLQIRVNDDRVSELGFSITDVDAFRTGLRPSLRPPSDPSLTPDPTHLAAHRDRWQS